MKRHPALELAVRNAACTECRLHSDTEPEDICITGQVTRLGKPRIAVVTKFPVTKDSRTYRELCAYFDEVGLDHSSFMWASALKCRTYSLDPTKTDQKTCSLFLRAEFAYMDFDYVLALGSEAWFAASGWANITQHRGKLFDIAEGAGVIFPTISPSAVNRNPGMRGGFVADLAYFARMVKGEADDGPAHHTNDGHRTRVMDKTGLKSALRAFRDAWAVSYDIETTGASEHDSDARVVSIAVTTTQGPDMTDAHTWEIPLYHPESPFVRQWVAVLIHIVKALMRCPRRVAHNAKYDTKWMQHFTKLERFLPTFDTIVAASVLDENRPKGLKPLAQMLLGAEPWGIDTKNLLETPLDEILTYNGLDTWHTLRLYFVFSEHLADRPRQKAMFRHILMPLVRELCYVERRGVYVDQDQLHENWNVVRSNLDRIHTALEQHLPESNPFEKYRKRDGVMTSDGVNWNPSNFLRWFVFEHLGMPVLATGKAKDDGSPGDPSLAEAVMMTLAEMEGDKTGPATLLLERVKWNKFDTAFFAPWSTQIDENSRMHSVFKPWGTVTGRLSSGKEDAEKITGKAQIRGVNLQQVPRGPLTRGVFGAPPGSFFVEFDYSQIELRIAAFLAREDTMLHLYATGQDIHTAMAMRMTGKPWHGGKCDCGGCVTGEERKKAKAVNFGFLYGMGANKFVNTAWENYGVRVTLEEAEAFRHSFFQQFPKLLPWHARQRKLARTYGRVETPMGRVRHLPDVTSPDRGVASEAERQAINSPVQGFASDMCALSMVLLAKEFREQRVGAWPIGTVHDAVNWEIEAEWLPVALPRIKYVMEHLPLEDLFNITVDVPIVADCKVGTRWGSATEVPEELLGIRTDTSELEAWLAEQGMVTA
jgi:DNA polymerase I-like protein with 3'-5' exonuclease and polymerase domains/uracil-DNA glycosylase